MPKKSSKKRNCRDKHTWAEPEERDSRKERRRMRDDLEKIRAEEREYIEGDE